MVEDMTVVTQTGGVDEVTSRLRKLPVSCLGYGFMCLKHKVFSVLHSIMLETGPSVSLLRWRLYHVRAWLTDLGVESHIADTRDCLPEFLASMGHQEQCARQQWLFPEPCSARVGIICGIMWVSTRSHR